MVKNLLTVKDVAEALKIRPLTVYQYVCRGVIPCVKIGSCLRFDEEAINELIKAKSKEVVVV